MTDVTNGADEERASVQPHGGRTVVASDVRTRRIGWSLVAVQALLLLLLLHNQMDYLLMVT